MSSGPERPGMNNDQVAKGVGTVTVVGITGARVSSKGIALPDGARAIYEQGEVAKFLATASAGGEVNVALIVSQTPTEEGKIVFGDFMMVKTKKNLSENGRVASLAITPKLKMAGFKGDVEGWTDTGPYIDLVNSIEFFRYNAYMGIHNVAPINICLLYTSDAADDLLCVDLGGRRIIKKKNKKHKV